MQRVIQAHVLGRVQGVGFRNWTAIQAHQRGITGWVRNLEDGSVLVCAAASSNVIADFIHLLHRGPPYARVDEVRVIEGGAVPQGDTFDILR